MKVPVYQAGIRAICSYLPENRLTNEMLAKEYPEWNSERIHQKTGISVRGVSGQDECASDLGVAAAMRLFESGICRPDEIDFLLFCTQSPDHFLPTTACLIQQRLGIPSSSGALDYNLGCSGFVYGLAMAKGLIETGSSKNLLLVTADTYSKFIHKTDRSVRTIFSDAGAAVLVSAMEADKALIGPFVFGTDGSGGDALIVRAGGLRNPITQETGLDEEVEPGIFRSDQNLYMDGPKILTFTLKVVPKLVQDLLTKSQMNLSEVDAFVFHQANRFMLEHLRKKIGIPKEKFHINMEAYGNTVSATIPMALELALRYGKVRTGDRIMLAGFGVGFSWAATMVQFV